MLFCWLSLASIISVEMPFTSFTCSWVVVLMETQCIHFEFERCWRYVCSYELMYILVSVRVLYIVLVYIGKYTPWFCDVASLRCEPVFVYKWPCALVRCTENIFTFPLFSLLPIWQNRLSIILQWATNDVNPSIILQLATNDVSRLSPIWIGAKFLAKAILDKRSLPLQAGWCVVRPTLSVIQIKLMQLGGNPPNFY